MEREKYCILINKYPAEPDRTREGKVRKFLLNYCDSISLVVNNWRGEKQLNTKRDPNFLKTLRTIKNDTIEVKRYLSGGSKPKYCTVYHLKLSKKIKEIINNREFGNGRRDLIYGLAEPIYLYKKGELIADIIRYENFFLLWLTKEQWEWFDKQGIYLRLYKPYICHNCGRGVFDLSEIGTERKGINKNYCKDCYVNGSFVKRPSKSQQLRKKKFETAKAHWKSILMQLKRWNRNGKVSDIVSTSPLKVGLKKDGRRWYEVRFGLFEDDNLRNERKKSIAFMVNKCDCIVFTEKKWDAEQKEFFTKTDPEFKKLLSKNIISAKIIKHRYQYWTCNDVPHKDLRPSTTIKYYLRKCARIRGALLSNVFYRLCSNSPSGFQYSLEFLEENKLIGELPECLPEPEIFLTSKERDCLINKKVDLILMFPICQSCGAQWQNDFRYGTEINGRRNFEYCAKCYAKGKFIEPNISIDEIALRKFIVRD